MDIFAHIRWDQLVAHILILDRNVMRDATVASPVDCGSTVI